MIQHVLLLFRHKKPVIHLLIFPLGSSNLDSTLCLSLLLRLSFFLLEVIEAIDELLSEEAFVLLEPIFLAAESCCFDVLYFELDGFAGDGGDVYVEIVPHKIIITVL